MRAAARHLVGELDFAAFATNPGYQRTRGTVRKVTQIRLIRRPHGIDLAVQGDGFLYNMVRTIAGTLKDVGVGKTGPEQVREILHSRDRSRAGMTAPPGGLFLVRVLYPASALGSTEGRGTVWKP
jgi:tRNA pseudouridine38-40 synthase